MTLLSIINEVCDIVGLDDFSQVYGSNDPNAETMVALANLGGQEIAARGDWSRLLRTETVLLNPFPLPDDYARMTGGGALYNPSIGFVRPVMNGAQWRILSASPSETAYYFVRDNAVEFLPTSAATGASIDYVSNAWCLHDPAGSGTEIEGDDDTTVFPERLLKLNLIWRWKRQKGLPYSDELSEFEAALAEDLTADRGAS